jgi:hypothetical protein
MLDDAEFDKLNTKLNKHNQCVADKKEKQKTAERKLAADAKRAANEKHELTKAKGFPALLKEYLASRTLLQEEHAILSSERNDVVNDYENRRSGITAETYNRKKKECEQIYKNQIAELDKLRHYGTLPKIPYETHVKIREIHRCKINENTEKQTDLMSAFYPYCMHENSLGEKMNRALKNKHSECVCFRCSKDWCECIHCGFSYGCSLGSDYQQLCYRCEPSGCY